MKVGVRIMIESKEELWSFEITARVLFNGIIRGG